MNSRNVDLTVATGIAGGAAIAAAVHPSTQGALWAVVAVVSGIPLSLVVPGYAITAALFIDRSLTAGTRMLLSVTSSIGSCVLGGLLLNALPAGLHRDTWAGLLLLITVGAAMVAFTRRASASDALTHVGRPPARRHWIPTAASLTVAAVAFTGALAMSHRSAESQPQPAVSQLWAVPAVTSSSTALVRIGAASDRGEAQTYVVRFLDNDRLVREWHVTVSVGRAWQQQEPVHRHDRVQVTLWLASRSHASMRSVRVVVP